MSVRIDITRNPAARSTTLAVRLFHARTGQLLNFPWAISDNDLIRYSQPGQHKEYEAYLSGITHETVKRYQDEIEDEPKELRERFQKMRDDVLTDIYQTFAQTIADLGKGTV